MATQVLNIAGVGEYSKMVFSDGTTYRIHSKDTITVSAMEQMQTLNDQIQSLGEKFGPGQIQLLIDLVNALAVDPVDESLLRGLPMAAFTSMLQGMVEIATGIVGEEDAEEDETPS